MVRPLKRLAGGVLASSVCLLAASVAAQSRVVTLTGSDGVTLKGTLYLASKPGPGVLLLHQCNRDRAAWNGLAQELAAAGLSVLTMDYRGFGESGGERFTELTGEALATAQAAWPGDIDIALEYLMSRPGISRDVVGVGGASCGVNQAVQTARRHPHVKSLVLLAGFTDRQGRGFLRTGRRVPTLFASAADDEFPTSILTTRWLYALTATPEKQLLEYPNGGHGAEMFAAQPGLVRAIVDWFVTSLRTTPGRVPVPTRRPELPKNLSMLAALDESGGPARIAAQLERNPARDTPAAFPESLVNAVGYEYLAAGNAAHAMAVFKLNVQAYPASPNAQDSLADGYVAAGQKDLARRHAQQALTLLAAATDLTDAARQAIRESAEAKLKLLGVK